MSNASTPSETTPGEAPRLRLLQLERRPGLDALVKLAASALGADGAELALIDDRPIPPNPEGRRVPMDGFCAEVLARRDTLVVSDAASDPRFSAHPMVRRQPHLRFFAGAPILASDGSPLGVVFVADREPRRLSASGRTLLRHVAALAYLALAVEAGQHPGGEGEADLHEAG